MNERRHPSKVDVWMMALIGWGLAMPLLMALLFALSGNDELRAGVPYLLATTASILLILAIFGYPTVYVLDERELRVRCGVLRYRVALEAIVLARPSRNPLSAPAWSLDRVRIDYRVAKAGQPERLAYLLISPKDREAFFDDLCDADPTLTRDEKGVIRAPLEGA